MTWVRTPVDELGHTHTHIKTHTQKSALETIAHEHTHMQADRYTPFHGGKRIISQLEPAVVLFCIIYNKNYFAQYSNTVFSTSQINHLK